jgi:acyl-coenzyme A synthetase/AMP-(fatty) acid ligase
LKIRPEPIEQALLELPGIVRAAVIALPDGTRGAIAVAAVEFAAGKRLPRRVLSQHCRARLGARFSPQRYYQADAMPLTRSGKIALASLREALMTGGGAFRELR